MFNIYIKNQQTGAKKIVDTAPDAYIADWKATRIWRTLDADHIAYIEPAQGWAAEADKAAQIDSDWQTWRRAHGFDKTVTV